MKRHALTLLLQLAAASIGYAADVGIEFSGVLTADGKTRVALTDVATNTTRWLEPGEVFNGYTITRYDAREDAIFLRKDMQEIRLGLEPSKTVDASRTAASSAPVLSATPSRTPPPVAPPAAPSSPPAAASQGTAAAPAPVPPVTPPPPATPAASTAAPAPIPQAPATGPAEPNTATPLHPDQPANVTAAAPAPEPPLTPTGRQPPSPTYVIRGGDTLESIALTQGVSVQQIRTLNPILHSTSLRAGDTIRIR